MKEQWNKDKKHRWWHPPPLALPFLPSPRIPTHALPSFSDYIFKVYLHSCKKCGNYIHTNFWFKYILETE